MDKNVDYGLTANFLFISSGTASIGREVNASTTDSEAVLRCEMTDYIRPDESLQWFQGEQQITNGGRHSIVYEDGTPFRAQNDVDDQVPGRVSVLTNSDPVVTDSGVYTCQIQGTAVSADIRLSITEGVYYFYQRVFTIIVPSIPVYALRVFD